MNGTGKAGSLLLLLLVAALASSAFTVIKVARASFDPYQLTFWRSGIGLLACLPFMSLRRSAWPPSARGWSSIAGIAVIGIILPFTLLNYAGGKIDSALVGILWSTLPIFGVVLSHFLTQNDRIGAGKVAGVLLGIYAVYLLTGYRAETRDWQSLGPHFAVIGAALCYAVSGILQRRLPPDMPGMQVTGLTMALGALLALALFPMGDYGRGADWRGIAAMLYLGVVASALLAYLRLRLIRRAGYSLTSYTGFLIPIFTMLLGVFLLGESVPDNGLAALGLALVAILLGQVPLRWPRFIPPRRSRT